MNRAKSINENPELIRKIVYAIDKAVTQDVPQDKRENRLETNNRQNFASGDYINDNLRKNVARGSIKLIPFKRYSWHGRIIVDSENKVTYTISTHQTLKTVIEKHKNKPHRSKPHYLETILHVENGDCEGVLKQMTFGDISPDFEKDIFDAETIEEDFDKIMQGGIGRIDGYKHYIIAYTAEYNAIIKIDLYLLDKDFDVVDKLDLIEYVTPDFASLTETQYQEIEELEESKVEEKPLLLKLRHGVKPALRVVKEKA